MIPFLVGLYITHGAEFLHISSISVGWPKLPGTWGSRPIDHLASKRGSAWTSYAPAGNHACCHVNLNDGKIRECYYLCCSWYLRTCAAAFSRCFSDVNLLYLVKVFWKSSSQTWSQSLTNQRSFNVANPVGPSASVLLLLQPLLVGRVSPSELRNFWHSPSVEN